MARPKKDVENTGPKVSPWTSFNTWLFGSKKLILDDETIKGINPRSVMCMFSGMYIFTKWLNNRFNNLYVIFQVDPRQFYEFLKEFVHEWRIQPSDITYFKHSKETLISKDIREKLPTLKDYEISLLLKLIKDDEDEEAFLVYLGLNKEEKFKKIKKVKEVKPKKNKKGDIEDETLLTCNG